MRLVRICISVTGLAVGSLVAHSTAAGAVTPCAPGQPPGRPPGQAPNTPPGSPPGRPPQYPIGQCQLQLSAAAAAPRTSVTAGGTGFAPRSRVTMTLGSAAVGSATADGEGRFTQAFIVPADMAPGQTEVRATGLSTDGSPYEQSATFEVLAPANTAAVAGTPGLRSGAGLAAAPQGGFGLAGTPLAGGGFTVLPGTNGSAGIASGAGQSGAAGAQLGSGTAGRSGTSTEQAAGLRASGNGAVGAQRISTGATGTALDRLNPLLVVGGGLALVGLGAATVVAARRRKPDEG